jgi:predicted DCC family thiol-disulfide oxidoreductase YuxK
MGVRSGVIFYDGYCRLCNRAVQFVLRRDRDRQFSFAPLQSETAAMALPGIQIKTQQPDSIVYLENGKIYQHSTAVLRIMKKLGRGWQFMYAFIILPAFIRDGIYRFIARYRYKWFGKRSSCALVPPDRMYSLS